MRTWIPWEEILEERMKEPGYAERMEIASRWLEEEIAKYGTVANPKPTPRTIPTFSRPRTKETLRRPATYLRAKAV